MMQLQKRPATNARKKFQRYESEKPKLIRKATVKEDARVKELIEIFRETPIHMRGAFMDYQYQRAADSVKDRGFSASDIGKFLITVKELEDEANFDEKLGYFLTALINTAEETHFRICTEHLLKKINHFGYANSKHIEVVGDLGGYAAFQMQHGEIVVNGNVGFRPGGGLIGGIIRIRGNAGNQLGYQMKGGRIIVEGNTGERAGLEMQGGEIQIEGDTGEGITELMKGGKMIVRNLHMGPEDVGTDGYGMRGGEIHVEGDSDPGTMESICAGIIHGKLYHKGELIVDK